MKDPTRAVVVEKVTDPEELAAAQVQDERFERNVSWLREHADEVYSHHRGKFICIAGGELFVADTAEEALSRARKVHPEDNGRYLRYIPREKMSRIVGARSTSSERVHRSTPDLARARRSSRAPAGARSAAAAARGPA
jgi:hypothetical protein